MTISGFFWTIFSVEAFSLHQSVDARALEAAKQLDGFVSHWDDSWRQAMVIWPLQMVKTGKPHMSGKDTMPTQVIQVFIPTLVYGCGRTGTEIFQP